MANFWLLLATCLSYGLLANGFQFIGCYIDQNDRDLPELVDKGNVYVGRCNFICSSRGFLFFALQASSECFCGNQYGRYGVAPQSDCNKRCRGNGGEYCGSDWRNSLYASDFGNSGLRSVGCFVDSNDRDLPALVSSDRDNQVGRCRDLCLVRNYAYFGLQAEGECWCGNNYGKHGESSERDCRKRCPGNRSLFCGGDWRNSVYATGRRLVQLPGGSDSMGGQLRAELAAQVRSQQIGFPGGVFCDSCLIAGWSRRESELRARVFHIRELDGVMSGYSDRVKEKLNVLKFGANTKNTFEDFEQTISGNYVVRSSFVGLAKRSGDQVEMGIVNAELVAYLVPKHHVFQRQSCHKVWFWTKCRSDTIRERIGYQVHEIELIDQAMRSETNKIFSERLG